MSGRLFGAALFLPKMRELQQLVVDMPSGAFVIMHLMSQITGIITKAEPRMIERRDGTGSFPLYEVWIDGQGPFVARKDVFNQAQALVNAQVEAITRTEQKGTYTNHYIDFVDQVGQTQMQQPNPAMQAQAHQPTQPGPAQTAADVVNEPTAAEERKNLSIHRQTATKVAAIVSKNMQEFWFNVDELMRWYQSGVKPFQNRPVTPDPIPHENQQNAAAYRPFQDDPGPIDRPPLEDQDIPF